MKSCIYNKRNTNKNIINNKKDINKIIKINNSFINELNFFTKINNNYNDYFYIFNYCNPLKIGIYDDNSKFIDEIEYIKTYDKYLLKYDNQVCFNFFHIIWFF